MVEETTVKRIQFSDFLHNSKPSNALRLTEDMKAKCPSLKEYNELFMSRELMNWWDADRYAYDNFAQLPSRAELKDIQKLFDTAILYEFRCWWTREVYEKHSRFAYCFYPENYACSSAEKAYGHTVFCLRR